MQKMNPMDFELTLNRRGKTIVNAMKVLENIDDGKQICTVLVVTCGNATIECPIELLTTDVAERVTARRDYMREQIKDML